MLPTSMLCTVHQENTIYKRTHSGLLPAECSPLPCCVRYTKRTPSVVREHNLYENTFWPPTRVLPTSMLYKRTHSTREHILQENTFYKRAHSIREHILYEDIFYQRTRLHPPCTRIYIYIYILITNLYLIVCSLTEGVLV